KILLAESLIEALPDFYQAFANWFPGFAWCAAIDSPFPDRSATCPVHYPARLACRWPYSDFLLAGSHCGSHLPVERQIRADLRIQRCRSSIDWPSPRDCSYARKTLQDSLKCDVNSPPPDSSLPSSASHSEPSVNQKRTHQQYPLPFLPARSDS